MTDESFRELAIRQGWFSVVEKSYTTTYITKEGNVVLVTHNDSGLVTDIYNLNRVIQNSYVV